MNARAYRLGVVMVLLGNVAAVALRAYAEAAFIAVHGAARLPWLLVATALGFALATLGYDALTRWRPARAVDPWLFAALAAAAATAPTVLAAGAPPVLLVVALTGLAQVAGLALWNRVAAAVAGRDARRALPRAGAAVTAGGAAAGLLAAPVIPWLGADALPYAAAGVALLVLAVARSQQGALDRDGAPGAAAPGATSAPPLAPVQRRLVGWLIAVALIEAGVATIADLQFAATIKARYPDALAIAVALFYGGTNLALLGLQALAVPRLLVTRSLPFTAIVHPVLVGLGYTGVLAAPGFAAIAGARTADQVFRAATSRPAQELALSALPPAPRARWKVLLRGVAWPAGAALAATALLAIGPAAVGAPRALAAAAVGLSVAWTVIARTAARRFGAALAAPLGVRAARARAAAATIDVATLERWTAVAGGDDASAAALARAALARARVAPSDLAEHLRHDAPAVRAAVFDQLARAPTPALRTELRAAVAIEDDDRALAVGIKALALAGDEDAITRGEQRAGLARDIDAAVATARLGLRGGDVLAALPELVARDPGWATAILRQRGSEVPAEILAARLVALAATAPGALRVIAAVGPPAALAALDAALAAGAPGARSAITELDGPGAAMLAAHRGLLSREARLALARTLAGAPAAGALALALAGDADPEVAHAALQATLASALAGGALAATGIAASRAAALAGLVAYLDARDGAHAMSACAREELELATRRCAARVLWAGAVSVAVAGGDPAPLVATARHLTRGADADRKRALDLVQELQDRDDGVLAALERWLRAPVATTAAPRALAATDAWLAGLCAGDLVDLEPALRALRRPTLFAAVAGPALAQLAARATRLTLAPDAELFAAGAPGDTLFVVGGGALTALRPPEPARRIDAGGVVGELAVLTTAPRAARVVAGPEGAELWRIERADFLAASRGAPELVLGLAATLAGWLAPGRADLLP